LGISSPSKVAADEVGAWFGPGLAQGIAANGNHAVAAAAKLARDVSVAAQGGGLDLNLSTGGFGALSSVEGGGINVSMGAGGAGGGNVIVNVAGHVWATQDLVREVQTQLLRHGIRNNTAGIDYTTAA